MQVETTELITVAQAAKKLNCSRQAIYKMMHRGAIRKVIIANSIFVDKKNL